jgi:hypothetical protein
MKFIWRKASYTEWYHKGNEDTLDKVKNETSDRLYSELSEGMEATHKHNGYSSYHKFYATRN